MKYYIAADGGGTKLQVILYDENLHIVNTARMSGTNTIHRPVEDMLADMKKLIDELIPAEIQEIECADLIILRYQKEFLELLKERCIVRNYHGWGENETPLFSTGVRYGVVAQAGTGSDAFLVQPDGKKTVGGWGFILGDEGSGYDIGMNGLKAAIYSTDGRGPKTLIYDILTEEWGLTIPWDIVTTVYGKTDYRSLVASVSRIVAKAAKQKDAVALKIYEDAGHEMAFQVLTVIANNGGVWEGPVVTSGGAWKGCPVMFETFRKDILEKYPDAEVRYPIFEPVVGCAVGRMLEEGCEFADFEETICREFGEFLYR